MTTVVPIISSKLYWKLYKMPHPHNFFVYRSIIDNIEFFRPFEPLKRCEFEEFFHFGPHCKGYDTDRVVIKNSQKPYYKPITDVTITKEGHWELK